GNWMSPAPGMRRSSVPGRGRLSGCESPLAVGRTGVRGGGPPARAGCCCARLARRSCRVCRAIEGPLAGLPVRGVTAAPAAVLLELDPVRRVPLGLLRLVVPPLALGAGERDSDSDSSGHLSSLPSR